MGQGAGQVRGAGWARGAGWVSGAGQSRGAGWARVWGGPGCGAGQGVGQVRDAGQARGALWVAGLEAKGATASSMCPVHFQATAAQPGAGATAPRGTCAGPAAGWLLPQHPHPSLCAARCRARPAPAHPSLPAPVWDPRCGCLHITREKTEAGGSWGLLGAPPPRPQAGRPAPSWRTQVSRTRCAPGSLGEQAPPAASLGTLRPALLLLPLGWGAPCLPGLGFLGVTQGSSPPGPELQVEVSGEAAGPHPVMSTACSHAPTLLSMSRGAALSQDPSALWQGPPKAAGASAGLHNVHSGPGTGPMWLPQWSRLHGRGTGQRVQCSPTGASPGRRPPSLGVPCLRAPTPRAQPTPGTPRAPLCVRICPGGREKLNERKLKGDRLFCVREFWLSSARDSYDTFTESLETRLCLAVCCTIPGLGPHPRGPDGGQGSSHHTPIPVSKQEEGERGVSFKEWSQKPQ